MDDEDDVDVLPLPLLLVRALGEAGVTPDGFVEALAARPVWREDAIRTADGRVAVEACLWPDGLRSMVRIGTRA